MSRPSFVKWATSKAGMYLHDKQKPTLASWPQREIEIFEHIFPGGDDRLPYSRIIWSNVKKSGKSELAAAVHLWFAMFVDIPGEQYVLSNDLQGARSRVFTSIVGSLEKNPHLKRDVDWSVVGNEIRLSNGSIIRAIPGDYRGEAGANLSFATVDEPWGILHVGAERLMTEFTPVPTRENSTVMYTGYQGFEGQSEWWHDLIDSAKSEPIPELAHIEDGDGNPACWRNGRLFLYWNHAAYHPWHTPDYLAGQRAAFKGRMAEYLRVWENRRVKNADAFCTPEQWEKLYSPTLRAAHVKDERPMILAVDAATKGDCSALVGTTWNEEVERVDVTWNKVWTPEPGTPIKLTETVGPEIIRLNREFKVVGVLFDPFQMAAIAEMCRKAGVNMVEFPQTARRVQSDTHLRQLIWGGNLAHYGDPVLREHVTNAMTKEGERGLRIVKELSSAKIDAAVALSMAALGTVEMLAGRKAIMEVSYNVFFGDKG